MIDTHLCLCTIGIFIAITLVLLLLVYLYQKCFKYNSSEKTLIESLRRAGFDVRDGDSHEIIAKSATLVGGNKHTQLTSYQTVPIMQTINGGSFEDIIDRGFSDDCCENRAEEITEDTQMIEPLSINSSDNQPHVDTLSDYRLSTTNNAKALSPDEYVLNQARPLMHLDIKHMHVNDYVWLEKTDGVREMYKQNDCILDCEKYDGKLYCFDALVVKGVDVRNRSYEERMDAIKRAKISDIIVKTYQPVDSIDELITYIQKNFKSPTTGHNIDGIILQERKKSYNSARVYKLKLPIMNTIDF